MLKIAFFLFLGLLIQPHDQTTTMITFQSIPNFCRIPIESMSNGLSLPFNIMVSMCLANISSFVNCHGVRCIDESSCEGITWNETSNRCFDGLETSNSLSKILGKVISKDEELFIYNGKEDNIYLVNNIMELEPFSISNPVNFFKAVTLYKNGIVCCQVEKKDCFYWERGSNAWITFPPMIFFHRYGSLDNVGGKLVAIGGGSSNNSYGGTTNLEIFDGNSWVEQPELTIPRRSFATVVINSTTLVLVGGHRGSTSSNDLIGSDFLMFHVDTGVWSNLPDYPKNQGFLTCCNFNYETVQGIFCIGGRGDAGAPGEAFLFNWNTYNWTRAPPYDMTLPHDFTEGSIIQFKNSLYYCPGKANIHFPWNTVYKLDLDGATPMWEDANVNLKNFFQDPLFLTMNAYELG